MRILWFIASLVCALPARAEVSVTASVDQNRVAFGESVAFTITVSGAQSGPQPAIPHIEGLTFAGPSINTSVSIVNGAISQSVSLVYQITPTRAGEFTIPAIAVAVAGKTYNTEPIKLTITQGEAQPGAQQDLFARVRLDSPQVCLGQTAPLDVVLFARANVPLKGVGNFSCEADGLGYRFLQNLKSGTRVINGETFNLHLIEGAISPTRTGKLTFGPCIIKAQIAVPRRGRGGWPFGDSLFDEMMGRVEVREQPVTLPEVPIEVMPLPAEGRPADFTGAVGQWNLEVAAKPTEVVVGDPITLTIKISGNGNIDTVSTPQLTGLDSFKTYDPTSKTTKNELSTTGERLFQQVLIPKSTDAKELPAVQLSYFDPVAKAYRTATQGPIKLQVKASGSGAVVSGSTRERSPEKLGEDIVYLKGELGPVETGVSWPVFWMLNVTPVLALASAIGWKRRSDRLRGDVAYARRSRAARQARRMLERAGSLDEVLRALQSYLGDRLNIPASGITASVAEERQLPEKVREILEACDAARFAGVAADVAALKQRVEQVINDLESSAR
jgi:hypothetical protein